MLSSTPAPAGGWAQPALATAQEIAPGLVFSGTAARVAALWVDLLLLGLVGGVVSATIGSGSASGFTPRTEFVWTTGDFLATIINVAINGTYFVAFWSGGRRATLGQMAFKIQVGNAFDGRPLTMEQAIRRWLGLGEFLSAFAVTAAALGFVAVLSLIWSVVLFFSTISSPTKQGLHDRFANTAVVRPANAGNGLAYTCLFLVIGLPILALILIIGLVFTSAQTVEILSRIGTSV